MKRWLYQGCHPDFTERHCESSGVFVAVGKRDQVCAAIRQAQFKDDSASLKEWQRHANLSTKQKRERIGRELARPPNTPYEIKDTSAVFVSPPSITHSANHPTKRKALSAFTLSQNGTRNDSMHSLTAYVAFPEPKSFHAKVCPETGKPKSAAPTGPSLAPQFSLARCQQPSQAPWTEKDQRWINRPSDSM